MRAIGIGSRTQQAMLGLVLAALTLWSPRVHACGCVEWPPERRMTEADRVFLGRYVRTGEDGDGSRLHFEVVHSLKGDLGARFELPRPADVECERSFQHKELALVFVVKGRLPICAGNFDLDKMLPTLGDYLRLAGNATEAPTVAAMKLALAGHLGRARKVSVYAPALAGKSIDVQGTRVTFVDTRGDELLALSGTTRGAVSYVALRSPDSIATFMLLAPEHGRLALVQSLKRDLKIK